MHASPLHVGLGPGRICPHHCQRPFHQVAPSWLEKDVTPRTKSSRPSLLQCQYTNNQFNKRRQRHSNEQFRHSNLASSLSCHATYKRLVEITKGDEEYTSSFVNSLISLSFYF